MFVGQAQQAEAQEPPDQEIKHRPRDEERRVQVHGFVSHGEMLRCTYAASVQMYRKPMYIAEQDRDYESMNSGQGLSPDSEEAPDRDAPVAARYVVQQENPQAAEGKPGQKI